ncbi:MAG: N-acetylglucosamine-6-phosphate deacetylase [Candidatus Raymondbacteria bacterium RifOxyA12_full_50_37]|nr:MAG: N-acetylglucosamine-6-phosphate deacetylase [Candidatus Raymondbacteria bacterium RifOxyA12_full_50_37]OGJ90149.1 MAG: N-acetylglucosamine-6-phosphate deacetylase [Candidatus Raymondbacteria bacterium RIFOXYA2_FULL_49_16]OGJ97220.1 MAG: N-acetylglucosamine-6-phosphate deacetylase [Candidatus Raymondbacteria bacterium RIFOXYC2_FULL_50_21]OGK04488.1 MAG: N-acetylglucosamine-6-phosphate deacetylase [Candidatus Raymondbacteria bacterium RifOxyB12_full_50_8]OGP43051.1 MAG: N-acetylglucosamin
MLALVNGRIVLSDKVVSDKAVIVEKGAIHSVVEKNALPQSCEIIDADNRLICPGLIDIHTHGAMGYSFNQPSAGAWSKITRKHERNGITSLCATLVTASLPDLEKCFKFFQQYKDQLTEGATILGLHLEGPYISPAMAGALNPKHIRTPNDGSAEIFLKYGELIRIFALAPELPGSADLARKLAKKGIVLAAGHSAAKEEEAAPVIRAGVRHITHIWSAQSTTVREGPWRKPGLLEVSLTYDTLTVEMIADNRHLPPTLMKLAYTCIGPDRLCAISDASTGAGLPEGSHFKIGDIDAEVNDGVAMLPDHSAFAGSTTLLNKMIPILVNAVSIPLHCAVRMASLTPARVLGIEKKKGSIESGKDADLVLFDDDFTAHRVMIAGTWR